MGGQMSSTYQAIMCQACAAVAVPAPGRQCVECSVVRMALESAPAAKEPISFPIIPTSLAVMALADLCRAAANDLDHLAEHDSLFEPATLRRTAHGVIRGLVNALGAKVAL